MRRLNITIDDKTFNLLEGNKNKSECIRQALEIQNLCVSPDQIKSLGATLRSLAIDYKKINARLKEIDSKMDYLTK